MVARGHAWFGGHAWLAGGGMCGFLGGVVGGSVHG